MVHLENSSAFSLLGLAVSVGTEQHVCPGHQDGGLYSSWFEEMFHDKKNIRSGRAAVPSGPGQILAQILQQASLPGYTAALHGIFQDCPTAEKESKVLRICSHVAGTCHSVPSCSREELREQKAGWSACRWTILRAWRSTLPATACTSCLEGVPGSQVPNDSRQQILPGDNTVQVNEQVVLGWPQKNVVRELLREPEGRPRKQRRQERPVQQCASLQCPRAQTQQRSPCFLKCSVEVQSRENNGLRFCP
ncbi:hypothetical protein CB1_012719003 [Camelus ferus]|nr:hypothetical protein CB1_012719003 [Camelus ferus]